MGVQLHIPEVTRRAELFRMSENRDLTPEKRKELADEADRLSEIIAQKQREFLNSQSPTFSERVEANYMAETDNAPVWPKEAKLVKQRVALIQDELYAKVMEICRGDHKVAVSAVGHVLGKVRGEKKAPAESTE